MTRLLATRLRMPARDGVVSIISDSFNRANGAIGTADTGQPWTAFGGTWTVDTNKAKAASGSGQQDLCTLESVLSDCTVQVNVTLSATRPSAGLALRATSRTNHLMTRLRRVGAANTIDLFKCVSNSYTLLAQVTGAGLNLGQTYQVKAVMAGTAVEVLLDGVSKLTYNTTTGFDTVTKHGLYRFDGATDDDGGTRWDDFTVVP